MELLKCCRIVKTFQEQNYKIKALDDVSLTVHDGEFVSVTGPSKSGKSTLLKIISGIDMPSGGKIIINDIDLNYLKPDKLTVFRRRNIGLISRPYGLFPKLNADENILLPSLLDKKRIDQDRLDMIINTIDITEYRSVPADHLSSEQQQRVIIGRALCNSPAFILADEPAEDLDEKTQAATIALLKKINRQYKQTIIIATHYDRIAMQTDRIIRIQDGKIISDEINHN